MALPLSFEKSGFYSPTSAQLSSKIRLKNGQTLKPILIGSDGVSDSGKTEFALSTPGNIQMIAVDRNFRGVFDNPTPPDSRNPNVAVKVISPPLQGTAKIPDYQKYHASVRDCLYDALENVDSQVVVFDGDSDWWELHILAHFGKTTQIYPSTRYAAPYAEKRAILARAFDSGKIVYFTNKVKSEYEIVYKEDGTVEKDKVTGEDLRRPTGRMETAGFKDQDYLYQIWIRHLYTPPTTRKIGTKTVEVPGQYGVRITKCKHNMSLVGTELWADDCNFKGLVQLVYPDVPLARWGF